MSHDVEVDRRIHEASRQAHGPDGFDYNAPAELFPTRNRASKSRYRYMRFDTAAEGLQFVIEQMAAPAALGAYLVIDEVAFRLEEMRYLYESPGYPLTRCMTASR